MDETRFKELSKAIPPIVPRHRVGHFLGGLYSAAYLANLDCLGRGPKDRFQIGGKVCYTRESLIEWLQARTAAVKGRVAA
jgi:hypothetical protein